jgi:hypothetical protein
LEHCIEGRATVPGEWMRRRVQVDELTRKHFELFDGIPETFQMRQVRMKIERPYVMQGAKPIESVLGLDRGRRPIPVARGTKTEAILYGNA